MQTVEETKSTPTTAKVESKTRVRRPLPAPGRIGSSEEGLAVFMKQYDNTLRELAK